MLPSADDFSSQIKSLGPAPDKATGIAEFVGKIADFTNQVQAGSTGTAGILTFGNAAMISVMNSMQPVTDNSWASPFADAWAAGISTAIITPGTVTDPTVPTPVWTGSGLLDIATLPSGTATIPNIAAAKAALLTDLTNMVATQDAPLPLATAIRNATLMLIFIVIGLSDPPSFLPIPLTIPAQ